MKVLSVHFTRKGNGVDKYVVVAMSFLFNKIIEFYLV